LPFLNPLPYAEAGTACFREIRSGSDGAYSAGAGYDSITGLGVLARGPFRNLRLKQQFRRPQELLQRSANPRIEVSQRPQLLLFDVPS
jgi:hypothetical protein